MFSSLPRTSLALMRGCTVEAHSGRCLRYSRNLSTSEPRNKERSDRAFVGLSELRQQAEESGAPPWKRKVLRQKTRSEYDRLRSKSAVTDSSAGSEQVQIPRREVQALFVEHVKFGRVWDAIELLESLEARFTLSPEDEHHMTGLFRSVRQIARSHKGETENSLVKRLMRLYRGRRIESDPRLTAYILMSFRDLEAWDRADSFWKWARNQNQVESEYNGSNGRKTRAKNQGRKPYLDLPTYGVAIEIFALSGRSLDECEELYQEALSRFPQDFNAYHLQPGAVLASPDTATSHRGTSLGLIGGIVAARLLHGDWRQAYLALDTAIKLHPRQLTGTLLYHVSQNRSQFEALAVCSIFARGGNSISSSLVGTLIAALRHSMSCTESLERRVQIFRLAAEMLCISKMDDTPLTTQHLDHLIAMLPSHLLPKGHKCTESLVAMVSEIKVGLMQAFSDSGVRSDLSRGSTGVYSRNLLLTRSTNQLGTDPFVGTSEDEHLDMLQSLRDDINNLPKLWEEAADAELIQTPSAWTIPFQSSKKMVGSNDKAQFDLVPRAWQQELYDKVMLLKDESLPSFVEEQQPPSSTEKQPPPIAADMQLDGSNRIEDILLPAQKQDLADLRFKNWCSMNDLLLAVEAYEAVKEQRQKLAKEHETIWQDQGSVEPQAKARKASVEQKIAMMRVVFNDFQQALARLEGVLSDKEAWMQKIIQLRTAEANEW